MIKHAAAEESPLYTATERVEAALDRLATRQRFNPEQELWLDRIRLHLIENLSIAKRHFGEIPVLELAGGWSAANAAFQGRLERLIHDLNEAVAA